MNIAIIGTGYVGLVSGVCFSEMGMDVWCVDNNSSKIESLQRGDVPIYEPGLEPMLRRNLEAGRLHFTTKVSEGIAHAEVILIAVGTPSAEDGGVELRYVYNVANDIASTLDHYAVIATKSTVPVGTTHRIGDIIHNGLKARGFDTTDMFDIVSNPEFLKEGAAIKDFMSPDRVVVGVESERAKRIMARLYKPFMFINDRIIYMDIVSAELTKYAANAMLATRISFMNELANLADRVGANIDMVRKGMGSDARIGSKFLYAGCGFGGSCFPKDVRALAETGRNSGCEMEIIEAVNRVNNRQKSIVVEKLKEAIKELNGKQIALWGLSFKPETDDMREAPSLVVIEQLLNLGATVSVFDPQAMEVCRGIFGDRVSYARDMYEATINADALIVVTEWKQFRVPSWAVVAKAMAGNIIVDGRNIYDRGELEEHGFVYKAIGK